MLTSVCVTSTASWAASSSLCSFPRQTMGAASALLDADSGLCGPGLYGGDFDVACMVEPTKMVELTNKNGGVNQPWWWFKQTLVTPPAGISGIWEDVLRRWHGMMVFSLLWFSLAKTHGCVLRTADDRDDGISQIWDDGISQIWGSEIIRFLLSPRFFVWIRTCAGKIM